jgi:hypothetical protein
MEGRLGEIKYNDGCTCDSLSHLDASPRTTVLPRPRGTLNQPPTRRVPAVDDAHPHEPRTRNTEDRMDTTEIPTSPNRAAAWDAAAVPERDYAAIADALASADSPVGIDAKHTHVLILHALDRIERRLAELERRLPGRAGGAG